MNLDITGFGDDIRLFKTEVYKGGNLLQTQQGSLEYAPDFGIDLRYFLESEFRFQNESFKAYLIQMLTKNGVNVTELVDTLENLYRTYAFRVGDSETTEGFVA